MADTQKNTLQTLERGIAALEIISKLDDGITVAQLAEQLDINRAIAYRIVTTLENHDLVARRKNGVIRLGAGAVLLSQRFEPQLRSVAQPLIAGLAEKTGATAFVSVAQGDECIVIMVEESNKGVLRVGYRVGGRHPLDKGAAGIAILANRPPSADDSEIVRKARADGFSLTRGQIQSGAVGIASPIKSKSGEGRFESCVGVVAMDDLDTELASQAVVTCAADIARALDF